MNKSYSKIRHIQEVNLKLEKRLISEEDYDRGFESNDEWLDWKAQRDESLRMQLETKKHILGTLHNFNTCLEATKQEIIEQYPALRMANMFSWADDITDLTMHEQSYAARELERMRSPDYSPQGEIDTMIQRADDSRARVFQQVRDRHERQKQNYAHLKPYMRLYRTINETILLTEQVTINPYGQGINGLEKLASAAEFLTDHTEGIDSYIIKGVKRCYNRFESADLLQAKQDYLQYEKEYEDLLNIQPTHLVKDN